MVATGIILTVIGIAIALVAWMRPKAPKAKLRGQENGELEVSTAWSMPVYGQPPTQMGDPMISVNIKNIGDRRHQISNWAINLGNGSNLFAIHPFSWDPQLPRWIDGGESVTFHMGADDIVRTSKEHGIPYGKMKAWIGLGDGSQIFSQNFLPIQEDYGT